MASKLSNFDDQRYNESNGSNKTFRKRVEFYFRRPIIYFCFGLPMMAPSICLVLLSHTEGGLNNTLILGSLLLVTSSASITTGLILGIRDCRKAWRRQALSEKNNTINKPSTFLSCELGRKKSSPGNNISNNINNNSLDSSDAASSPRSRKSSGASIKSLNNNLTGVEKAKLISLNLKRKSMNRRKGKRGVKFPTEPLPPLTEEESFVKSLSRGNTSTSLKTDNGPKSDNWNNSHNKNKNSDNINNNHKSNVGTMSVDELKDYLNVIGLGGGPQDKLSKSLDEDKLSRPDPPIAVSTKEPPLTSRDPPMRTSSPTSTTKYPTVVTHSHERTGIRLP